MARQVLLFTAQYGDIPLETLCAKIKDWGYDGIVIACNDNHLNLDKLSQEYCDELLGTLKKYNLA